MARILIAEDEPRIASFLEKGLRANGFATLVVDDGLEATVMARDSDFDLMVLDLGLPGRDGLEVLERVRRRGERLPVIILTARREVGATVAGLEGGADDYVTKPFRFEELLARIRVRLRSGNDEEPTLLRAGLVALDLRTRRATVGDRSVELTSREFALGRDALAPPRPRTVARAAPQPRLGLRLRPRVERGRRLHPLPAQEARARRDRDRAWHGLPAAHGAGRGHLFVTSPSSFFVA